MTGGAVLDEVGLTGAVEAAADDDGAAVFPPVTLAAPVEDDEADAEVLTDTGGASRPVPAVGMRTTPHSPATCPML